MKSTIDTSQALLPRATSAQPRAELLAGAPAAALAADSSVLKVDHVGHTYRGGCLALSDINMAILPGEVIGLLGPNGAGKSSLIKIISGLMKPATGRVSVVGKDLFASGRAIRNRVCALLQRSPIEPNMTVREVLALFSTFYDRPRQVDPLLAFVGLEDKADTRIHRLSGGQQQRVALARAMIGNPDVLILDEPTTGLDVAIRKDFLSLIRTLKAEGHTVLLSTHLVDEADQLCDRVAVLNKGKLCAFDTPSTLMYQYGQGDQLEALFENELPEGSRLVLPPSVQCRHAISPEGPYTYVLSGGPAEYMLGALAELAAARNASLLKVRVLRGGLESAYLHLTGERIDS